MSIADDYNLDRITKMSGLLDLGRAVANQGIQNQWHTTYKGNTLQRELTDHGEQYRCHCPFCNDTRHRCYVNYEFGVVDPFGQSNLHLIKCFNEECFTYDPEKRNIFFMEVLYGRPVLKSSIQSGKIRQPGEYTSPGTTIPIHKLDPTHSAITYLTSRGFDPIVLWHVYKVSWCTQSNLRFAQSRIIIPVIENGVECGWLARIAQNGDFMDEAGRRMPKYYNMPGFQSQKHLYNFDQAKNYKTIILVEGALDAIKVGPPAIALLGKSVSTVNVERLVSFADRNDVLIVVCLDPDKPVTDRSSKHHIEVAVSKLKRQYSKVMPMYLPTGSDPASLDRSEFRRLLNEAAEKEGIKLDFSRITSPTVGDQTINT